MSLNSASYDLKPRLMVFALLLLSSYILWIVLEPYKLRMLAAVIPVLFVIQVFLNDFLESFLINKFYKTWWFKFVVAPGTILHEICHLIAAVLTGCHVESISLFKVNPESGTLGYVKYSNPEDNWNVLREFIVGLAPFFGCGLLLLGLNIVLGGSLVKNVGVMASDAPRSLVGVLASLLKALLLFFEDTMSRGYAYIILVYMQLCFALGSAPSGQDFKNALSSIVKHPLSAIFFILLASLVVLLAESPVNVFGLGEMLSNAIIFLFKFVVYVLLISIAVLCIALPTVLAVSLFFSLKGKIKYLILLVSAALFVVTEGYMAILNRISLSLFVFLFLTFTANNPGIFLKKD
ncbi:MAG: hypothetical protein NTU61_00425 [Candidatus Altiarchaeota archaeon]|nr:hypothetical protein [Candidatus Altiarchaeota archaeon]